MNSILNYWTFSWTSALLLLVSIILFTTFFTISRRRIGYFIAAIIILLLCFFSPLQVFSLHYLFSAHMIVHVLLLLCAGPLLVLSLSDDSKNGFFRFTRQHPLLCWLTGVGVMWLWHVPVLFNSTMAQAHHTGNGFQLLHFVEAGSLLLAGILFSAPVIHPNKSLRIDAMSGVVYLFTACIGCSVLGLLITFAPVGTFHHYLSLHDPYRFNDMIQYQWGLTQLTDQQIAGLIMWVPCCLIYVSGALYLLAHWFQQKEELSVPLKG